VALGKFRFKAKDWQEISEPAKDLISLMLKPVEERITAADALQHPWMTN
jgi:hypothetical protein